MARPSPDVAAVRQQMLLAAEALLTAHGPDKLTMSDIAARCGMSQSNAYRFFANKQALLEALGTRWFRGVEEEAAAVVARGGPPAEQLARFVGAQYRAKRRLHDADPALFRAYLVLGQQNMAVVERHLARLRGHLRTILERCATAGLLGGRAVDEAVPLVEALTTRFRNPVEILRHAETDSVGLAEEAARLVLAGMQAVPRRPG